jgi:hypothetical protein
MPAESRGRPVVWIDDMLNVPGPSRLGTRAFCCCARCELWGSPIPSAGGPCGHRVAHRSRVSRVGPVGRRRPWQEQAGLARQAAAEGTVQVVAVGRCRLSACCV